MATRFVTSNGSFYPNGFGPIGFGGLYNSLQFNGSNQYDAEGLGGSAFTAWVISTNPPSTSTSWEWLNTDPSAFRGSYGFNQWLFKGFHNPVVAGSAALKCGLDVLSLRGRADIPVLLDAAGPCSAPIATTSGGPLGPDGGPDYYMANFVTNRHGEFTNALFLDWSVRRVGLKELWTLPWYAEFNRAGTWTKAGRVKPEAWPKWMRGFKDY
jgi:prepilin-type processing-associated H-X9-DG protein